MAFDALQKCELIAKTWNDRWPVGTVIFVVAENGEVYYAATDSEAYVGDVDAGTCVYVNATIAGFGCRIKYGTFVPYNPNQKY